MYILNIDNHIEVVELELKKTHLLHRFLHLHLDIKPSNKGHARMPRRSMSDGEKKKESTLKTWNLELLSKLCSLKRSIDIVQKSGMHADKIGELLQSYELFRSRAIESTKPVTSVNSVHPFVNFMQDNAVHPDLVRDSNELLSVDPSSLSPCEVVMQDKLLLCNLALTSKMKPEIFLQKWNVLEEKDEEATKGVVCEEGLYDRNNKEVIEPGTTWRLNTMHGLTLGGTSVAVKHWHPPIDSGKPNFQNGCVTAVTELDPRLTHLEGGGGEMTPELDARVKAFLVVLDLFDIFPKEKPTWKKECKEFARLNGMTFTRFTLRGMIRIQAQCLLNTLNGQETRCVIFTADGCREGYQFLGASASRHVVTGGPAAHGEGQCVPMQNMTATTYSLQDLDDQSAALVILLSSIDGLRVSSKSKVMRIVARRDGEEKLTPEQQKIFNDALKQQRSDNGIAAYKTMEKQGNGLAGWHKDATKQQYIDNYETQKKNGTGLAGYHKNATKQQRNASSAKTAMARWGKKPKKWEDEDEDKLLELLRNPGKYKIKSGGRIGISWNEVDKDKLIPSKTAMEMEIKSKTLKKRMKRQLEKAQSKKEKRDDA